MPMTREAMEFREESAIVIMLDGKTVKVFSEDLCLHPLLGTDLNLGQIPLSFCSSSFSFTDISKMECYITGQGVEYMRLSADPQIQHL